MWVFLDLWCSGEAMEKKMPNFIFLFFFLKIPEEILFWSNNTQNGVLLSEIHKEITRFDPEPGSGNYQEATRNSIRPWCLGLRHGLFLQCDAVRSSAIPRNRKRSPAQSPPQFIASLSAAFFRSRSLANSAVLV
jgi:hypothetical protein